MIRPSVSGSATDWSTKLKNVLDVLIQYRFIEIGFVRICLIHVPLTI